MLHDVIVKRVIIIQCTNKDCSFSIWSPLYNRLYFLFHDWTSWIMTRFITSMLSTNKRTTNCEKKKKLRCVQNECVYYRYNGLQISNAYGPGSGPIWLSDVECNGDETDIMQCRHAAWGSHNCDHSQDVSISCVVDSSSQYAGQEFYCHCANFWCALVHNLCSCSSS